MTRARSSVVLTVKEKQFNLGGVAGKDAEVYAIGTRCCPEWRTFACFTRK
jgi:hypothetical protein